MQHVLNHGSSLDSTKLSSSGFATKRNAPSESVMMTNGDDADLSSDNFAVGSASVSADLPGKMQLWFSRATLRVLHLMHLQEWHTHSHGLQSFSTASSINIVLLSNCTAPGA